MFLDNISVISKSIELSYCSDKVNLPLKCNRNMNFKKIKIISSDKSDTSITFKDYALYTII